MRSKVDPVTLFQPYRNSRERKDELHYSMSIPISTSRFSSSLACALSLVMASVKKMTWSFSAFPAKAYEWRNFLLFPGHVTFHHSSKSRPFMGAFFLGFRFTSQMIEQSSKPFSLCLTVLFMLSVYWIGSARIEETDHKGMVFNFCTFSFSCHNHDVCDCWW